MNDLKTSIEITIGFEGPQNPGVLFRAMRKQWLCSFSQFTEAIKSLVADKILIQNAVTIDLHPAH